jgi:hypothetical protein
MDRLAKQQTCQLFIEQEIEKGLAEGKSHRAIGKELAQEIKRIFLAVVNPETIRKRADRISGTFVPPDPTQQNDSNNSELEKLEITTHGGMRKGAGRPAREQIIDIEPDETTETIERGEDTENIKKLKYLWIDAREDERKVFISWALNRNEISEGWLKWKK